MSNDHTISKVGKKKVERFDIDSILLDLLIFSFDRTKGEKKLNENKKIMKIP